MGQPRPGWTIADLAVQAAGGISVGVYPTSSPAELRYLLRHAGARFMIAEDQEPLDKALAVSADCPRLERIFVVDTRALFAYRDERIARSEEHTSELQSRSDLVCRLLLEKKKTANTPTQSDHFSVARTF